MQLHQKGMSIIELLIAASLTAIVALGSASLIYNSAKTSRFATVQNDIDRVHYLNIQIARNVTNIQKLYSILPPTPTNADALACLQMAPTADCSTFKSSIVISSTGTTAQGVAVGGSTGFPLPATDQNIQSTITITPHCLAGANFTGCDYITVSVSTQYIGGGYATRNSVSNLPNFLFVPRNEIKYKCPLANQVMYGIDYYNQVALCNTVLTGLAGESNTGAGDSYLPLLVYDSGTTTGNFTAIDSGYCPDGFLDAGITDSSCRTGSLTVPPTVTTTTLSGPPPLPGPLVSLTFASCFVAGTQVTLADGSTENIESVKVGEKILTYDEVRDQQVIRPVIEVFHHPEKVSDLYTMTLDNGTRITSNDVHPFYLVDYHQYESAARIYDLWRQGSEIHLLNSKNHRVSISDIKKTTKLVKLYNLHVQSTYDQPQTPGIYGHNYFANGVLVHNLKCSHPCEVARYEAAYDHCCTDSFGTKYNRSIGGYPGVVCKVDTTLAGAVNACVASDPAVTSCYDPPGCL